MKAAREIGAVFFFAALWVLTKDRIPYGAAGAMTAAALFAGSTWLIFRVNPFDALSGGRGSADPARQDGPAAESREPEPEAVAAAPEAGPSSPSGP